MDVEETTEQSPTKGTKYGGDRLGRWRNDLTGWGFVLPFLIAYTVFLIYPVLRMFEMSFTNRSLVGTGGSQFLGLANYRELLGDAAFWNSLWNTAWFTILSTPPLIIIALVLALLTNRVRFAQWFFRFTFFAPFILPVSVAALIWIWLYQPGFGLLNSYLGAIGLGDIGWLSDPQIAMISVVIMTVWWTVGFNFVLYLAGLQEIPRDLYDAAAIDGATPLAQTRWITLPLLKRTTILVLVLQILNSLKVFDQIYIMTYGGPNFSTRPVIEYFYDQGFTNYRVGFASAVSTVFFFIILAASVGWFVYSNRKEKA